MPSGAGTHMTKPTAPTNAAVLPANITSIDLIHGTLTRAPQSRHRKVRAGPRHCFCQRENAGLPHAGQGSNGMPSRQIFSNCFPKLRPDNTRRSASA